MRIVQIIRGGERRLAVVEDTRLKLLSPAGPQSAYAIANESIRTGRMLQNLLEDALGKEWLDYDQVYDGRSDWKIVPPFDHPAEPARCLVSGTGLTHKASAENRTAMHEKAAAQMTDSMRMYQMGIEGGRPGDGEIGVQPEWFYKGNGRVLRAHGDDLIVPEFADDGGEEPEIAGVYVISDAGVPFRVGFTIGNEFSDHRMEKQNYLYLAPSKLRNCSIGPELTVGEFSFSDLRGRVSVLRRSQTIWSKDVQSGEQNMCHSLRNLEHHHFKYDDHRRPGDAHVHFFGASAFSFGDGLALEEGDVMEISFPSLGRPLRNTLRIERKQPRVHEVRAL